MPGLIDTAVRVPESRCRQDGIAGAAEAYLKAVLELEEAGGPVIRARIANRLGHSNPSTNQYIDRLRQAELLSFEDGLRSPTIALTPNGRRRAVRALRQHRLAECYLHDVLDLDWCQVHQEASLWERVMSTAVTDRFDELLGSPTRSPYGNPIPAADDHEAAYLASHETVIDLVTAETRAKHCLMGELQWIGEPAQEDPGFLADLRRSRVLPDEMLHIEFGCGGTRITSDSATDAPLIVDQRLAGQLFIRVR